MKFLKLDKRARQAVLLGGLAVTALSLLCFHEDLNVPPMVYLLCGLAWGSVYYIKD